MATPQEDYPNPPFTGDDLASFYDFIAKTREAYGLVNQWQSYKDSMNETFTIASPVVAAYQQNSNYGGQEVGHLLSAFRDEFISEDMQGWYRQAEFVW